MLVGQELRNMDTKVFHLKFENHEPNLAAVFSHLYETSALADVNIVCAGGESLRAHKIILSSSSNYFLQLFLDADSKRPSLSVPEIDVATMRRLLSFIYTGEVEVTENVLENLLAAAEALEIRGLTTSVSGRKGTTTTPPVIKTSSATTSVVTSPKPSVSSTSQSQNAIFRENKPEEIIINEGNQHQVSNDPLDGAFYSGQHEAQPPLLSAKAFSCNFCQAKFTRASHLARHKRTHTGERPFVCSWKIDDVICGKTFSRQDKLKTHYDRHLAKDGLVDLPHKKRSKVPHHPSLYGQFPSLTPLMSSFP